MLHSSLMLLFVMTLFKDIIKKLVCEAPSRDCYMGSCQLCKDQGRPLKQEVIETFDELEFYEVQYFSF